MICLMIMTLTIYSFAVVSEEPTVIEPYNGEIKQAEDIRLKWQAVSNAGYNIALKDVDLNQLVLNKVFVQSNDYMIKQAQQKNASRYERSIKTENRNISTPSFLTIDSIENTFEAPVMNKPYNGEIFHNANVHITWVNSGQHKSVGRVFNDKKTSEEKSPTIRYANANQKNDLKDIGVAWEGVANTLHYNMKLYDESIGAEVLTVNDITATSFNIEKSHLTYDERFDCYLIVMKDMTSGEYLYDREKVDLPYIILKRDSLEYDHQYKIAFASVKEGKEYWNESFFDVKHQYMDSPMIYAPTDMSVIPLDDLRISWRDSKNIEHYEVTLKDTTDSKMIVDAEVTIEANYTVEKSKLEMGHQYHLYIRTIRPGEVKSEAVDFSVAYDKIERPRFKDESIAYMLGDVLINWHEVIGAENYFISLLYRPTNEIVLENVEVKAREFLISKEVLEADQNYRIIVKAKSQDLEKKTYHDFSILKNDFDVSRINTVSTWAKGFVLKVYDKKLLDEKLFDQLISEPKALITRVEFAEILVALYDRHASPEVREDMNKDVLFKDLKDLAMTEEEALIKAFRLGIMNGESRYVSNPYGHVSRQQMATMLLNTYHAMYGNIIEFNYDESYLYYEDYDKVDEWAKHGVWFTSTLGLFEGNNEKFNPSDSATHEMAFVLLEKTFVLMNNLFVDMYYYIGHPDEINETTTLTFGCRYKGADLGSYHGTNIEVNVSDTTIIQVKGITLYPLKDGTVELSVLVGKRGIAGPISVKMDN